jgi:hypothetical protein
MSSDNTPNACIMTEPPEVDPSAQMRDRLELLALELSACINEATELCSAIDAIDVRASGLCECHLPENKDGEWPCLACEAKEAAGDVWNGLWVFHQHFLSRASVDINQDKAALAERVAVWGGTVAAS